MCDGRTTGVQEPGSFLRVPSGVSTNQVGSQGDVGMSAKKGDRKQRSAGGTLCKDLSRDVNLM